MEQDLALIRNEIEEIEEDIFALRKEKDEKLKIKEEILARKKEKDSDLKKTENGSISDLELKIFASLHV